MFVLVSEHAYTTVTCTCFEYDTYDLCTVGTGAAIRNQIRRNHTQHTHDAIMTSLLRQNDVATSFWRNNDVIIVSYKCWDMVAYHESNKRASNIRNSVRTVPDQFGQYTVYT